MVRPTKRTAPGPIVNNVRHYSTRWRLQKASEGSKELSVRVGEKLGIPAKEANSLLKIIGLEMCQMAYEGWIFSFPNFATFWTYLSPVRFRFNVSAENKHLSGGNKRLNFLEHTSLIKYLKQSKKDYSNEVVPISRPKQDAK